MVPYCCILSPYPPSWAAKWQLTQHTEQPRTEKRTAMPPLLPCNRHNRISSTGELIETIPWKNIFNIQLLWYFKINFIDKYNCYWYNVFNCHEIEAGSLNFNWRLTKFHHPLIPFQKRSLWSIGAKGLKRLPLTHMPPNPVLVNDVLMSLSSHTSSRNTKMEVTQPCTSQNLKMTLIILKVLYYRISQSEQIKLILNIN